MHFLVNNAFSCEQCSKVFANRRNLSQHVRRNHRPCSKIFRCYYCKFETKYKNTLKHHILRHDKPQTEKKLHICVLCHRFNCEIREEMIKHYVSVHEVQLNERTVSLKSYQDFENWKIGIERANACRFTCAFGKRERKDVDIRYYRCFRDGIFHSEGKGVRRLKSKGSIKIGGICPASMKVVTEKETGVVQVYFIPTHVGHGENLAHLNLTKEEKAEIAGKLAQNIPYQVILDQIKTSKQDELRRIHLTTRKDIANVRASFKLGNVDNEFPHNDRTSVEAWIRHMEQDTNTVRFYKPQGVVSSTHPQLLEDDMFLIIASDFQLDMFKKYGSYCICFDGTHSLDQHEFELTTVLVLDELRQGIPCMFLFSSRCDTEIISLLVTALHGEVGSIQPIMFMTDMSLTYINGWRSCMPEPKNVLFCSWDVDREWRNNLFRVKSADKKKEVYRTVRQLMEEVDETAFLQLTKNALEKFVNDPSTEDFGNYFKENYFENMKQWAFCYRKNFSPNTNIHLENMRRVLQYMYLDGNKVKRLDKTISALLRMVQDKYHDQHIARKRGNLTPKMSIKKQHDTSIGMSCTVQPCSEGWLLASKSSAEMNLVRKLTNAGCDCEMKCLDCNICIHDFACDCIDSVVKFNICKHIHLVASCWPVNQSTFTPAGENDCDDITTDDISMQEISIAEKSKGDAMVVSENSLKNKISKIRKKFNEILENLQTDEHADILWNTLLLFNAASSTEDSDFVPAT